MIYLQKTTPEPAALTTARDNNTTYLIEAILSQIRADFKNKCYICEGRPISINIEHFMPHRGNHALRYSWENLFYCCGHCNNTKGDKANFDDILNCTTTLDIDAKIKYLINPLPKEKARFEAMENSPTVSNTMDLLNETFNGTTDLKVLASANLRKDLLSEIRKFNDLLFEYENAEFDLPERARVKGLIEAHLRPASLFTAFKRWIIRDSNLAPEFTIAD